MRSWLLAAALMVALGGMLAASDDVADPALAHPAVTAPAIPPDNPRIDMDGYLRIALEAAVWRRTHRLSEADFLAKMHEPGVIVLDARSAALFAKRHIAGAINLSFPDISIPTLAQTLPDKNATILIYCNNNFINDAIAFPSKSAPASLNIPTFITLYSYGYRNIYELAPLLDVHKTVLPLVPIWTNDLDATK